MLISTLLLLALMTACAGKNFVRPADGILVVGKTTRAEVHTAFGPAQKESTVMKNGRQVTLLGYVYATVGGTPLYQGVTPGRAITLGFDDTILVSTSFQSSFRDDGTDFDETKTSMIVRGKTTEAESRQLFGRPGGEQIFPLQPAGKTALVYSYSHFRNTGDLQSRTYSKLLMIRFDGNKVVEDYELAISGKKM